MSDLIGSVFINCPYDDEYETFFKALVFLCFYFHFEPRFACEDYSSASRQQKIISMIQETDFAIHDLSRVSPSKNTGLPRFNMPFELGMDVMHCAEGNTEKKLLVLDGRKGNYEKLLSDLKCADVEAHEDSLAKLFSIVRKFFIQIGSFRDTKGPSYILNYFQLTFHTWLQMNLRECDLDMESDVSMLEYKQKVFQFFEEGFGAGANRT